MSQEARQSNGMDQVVGGPQGPERLRRERAWSDARRSDPSVRVTLKAHEVYNLVARLRSDAEYGEQQAEDYERQCGYENTVAEYRARAVQDRARADQLENVADAEVGKVYRRLLVERAPNA
jgi:hypothetical protein